MSAGGEIRIGRSDGRWHCRLPALPDVAALLRGQPLGRARQWLPSLYALCGEAHAIAIELAARAAGSRAAQHADAETRAALRRLIARMHAQAIVLDWPRILGAPGPQAGALGRSTLLSRQPDPQRVDEWLEREIVGLGPQAWLSRWRTEGPEQVLRLIIARREPLVQLLEALDPDIATSAWPGGEGAPDWRRRLPVALSAGALLLGRVAELLAYRAGEAWPGEKPGSGPLAEAVRGPDAMSWSRVGIARGRLCHGLRLSSDRASIIEYRVVAPTETLFAPEGPFERWLEVERESLGRPGARRRLATMLLLADPCYPVRIAEEINA